LHLVCVLGGVVGAIVLFAVFILRRSAHADGQV
jgi:hypothetical protein